MSRFRLTLTVRAVVGIVGLSETLSLERLDFLLDLNELGRLEPQIRPVSLADHATRAGSNGLEHVLGGVGVLGAVTVDRFEGGEISKKVEDGKDYKLTLRAWQSSRG